MSTQFEKDRRYRFTSERGSILIVTPYRKDDLYVVFIIEEVEQLVPPDTFEKGGNFSRRFSARDWSTELLPDDNVDRQKEGKAA